MQMYHKQQKELAWKQYEKRKTQHEVFGKELRDAINHCEDLEIILRDQQRYKKVKRKIKNREVKLLVFTSQDVLNHKLKDGLKKDHAWCYWTFRRMPIQIDLDARVLQDIELYVAVKGQVKGFFKIHNIGFNINMHEARELELEFFSDSWTPIEDGQQLKPSQGWRYYKEEKNEC